MTPTHKTDLVEQQDTFDTFTSFEDILNVDPNEVERPKPLPTGLYECVVADRRFDRSSVKLTPFVEFTLRPIAALDDVNMDELNEQGGIGNRTLRITFYRTEDKNSLWRLKEFLENCGVDYNKNMGIMVEGAINSRVGAVVFHKPSADNKQMFANVEKTISL